MGPIGMDINAMATTLFIALVGIAVILIIIGSGAIDLLKPVMKSRRLLSSEDRTTQVALIMLSLAVAIWRATFTAIPLDLTSAGLNRDAAHFLLGALIACFFSRRYRRTAIICFAALTILEGGLFIAFRP